MVTRAALMLLVLGVLGVGIAEAQPTGACLSDEGTLLACSDNATAEECAIFGDYQGDGTTCGDIPSDGTCEFSRAPFCWSWQEDDGVAASRTSCEESTGTFTEGATCSSVPTIPSSGLVILSVLLLAMGGWIALKHRASVPAA